MMLKILLLLLFSPLAYADILSGRVIKVTDGDTITIVDLSNTQHKIRLSGVDAPERKQAYGVRSKESLASAVAGQLVKIDWNKRDKYKRIVGRVIIDDRDINLEQVMNGMAWHYKKYESEQDVEDRSLYAQAEYLARRDKKGLWADKLPIAPWEWRKYKN